MTFKLGTVFMYGTKKVFTPQQFGGRTKNGKLILLSQPNSIHYQYTLADQIFCYPCHETFSINGQEDTEMFSF